MLWRTMEKYDAIKDRISVVSISSLGVKKPDSGGVASICLLKLFISNAALLADDMDGDALPPSCDAGSRALVFRPALEANMVLGGVELKLVGAGCPLAPGPPPKK